MHAFCPRLSAEVFLPLLHYSHFSSSEGAEKAPELAFSVTNIYAMSNNSLYAPTLTPHVHFPSLFLFRPAIHPTSCQLLRPSHVLVSASLRAHSTCFTLTTHHRLCTPYRFRRRTGTSLSSTPCVPRRFPSRTTLRVSRATPSAPRSASSSHWCTSTASSRPTRRSSSTRSTSTVSSSPA